jgi:hypothetical protein
VHWYRHGCKQTRAEMHAGNESLEIRRQEGEDACGVDMYVHSIFRPSSFRPREPRPASVTPKHRPHGRTWRRWRVASETCEDGAVAIYAESQDLSLHPGNSVPSETIYHCVPENHANQSLEYRGQYEGKDALARRRIYIPLPAGDSPFRTTQWIRTLLKMLLPSELQTDWGCRANRGPQVTRLQSVPLRRWRAHTAGVRSAVRSSSVTPG